MGRGDGVCEFVKLPRVLVIAEIRSDAFGIQKVSAYGRYTGAIGAPSATSSPFDGRAFPFLYLNQSDEAAAEMEDGDPSNPCLDEMQKTKIKHLPSSVRKLRNLETLILEHNFLRESPVEIFNLQRLRHFSVTSYSKAVDPTFHQMDGAEVGGGVGSLTFLQVLRLVEVENGAVGELGKLIQLRSLGIAKLKRGDGHDLCTSIEKMSHFKSSQSFPFVSYPIGIYVVRHQFDGGGEYMQGYDSIHAVIHSLMYDHFN
ncbi:hypothetical protein ACLOJK_038044 [Asimina triloba]